MKTFLLPKLFISAFLGFTILCQAQVGIGTTEPHESSMLDIQSTSAGVLVSRMNTAQREAIENPAEGLLVYDTSTSSFWYHNGIRWMENESAHQMVMPKGEISYYKYEGFAVGITNQTPLNENQNSATQTMTKITAPEGTSHFVNDHFGTGDNSRLTYTGAHPKYFHCALSFSYTPNTGNPSNPPTDTFVFGVAKNGVVQDSSKLFITTSFKGNYESTAMHVLLRLEKNDYVEFFVGNVSDKNDLRINAFNFVAVGM